MDISINTKTNFTARNKEIRDADKIMRNLINRYPAISTSKATYYDIIRNKKPSLINKIKTSGECLIHARKQYKAYTDEKSINEVFYCTKKFKLANCREYAHMALGAFAANGYKDLEVGRLYKKVNIKNKNGKEEKYSDIVDHVVLLVNGHSRDKKPFIVDPWRGFVDYLENGLTRFDGLFMKGFRKMETEEEHIRQKFTISVVKRDFEITDSTCRHFAKEFPELIVKT